LFKPVIVMRCEEFKSNLLEYAASDTTEAPTHAKECAACAAELDSFRATMNVLDEWVVPEPSPYFDVRLKARLREEAAQTRLGWRERLAGIFSSAAMRYARVPAMAAVLGAAVFAGVSFYHSQSDVDKNHACAVVDVQTFDKNYDLINDLDSLDDSASQVMDTTDDSAEL
jgi:hypothetical protein